MKPVPLAPYVTRGVLQPDLDAVQLSKQTYQAVLRDSEVEPRISLVCTYSLTLATVEKRAWDVYLATPIPKGPLPQYEAARRELAHALQAITDADLSHDSPWDVVTTAAGNVTPRSGIAGDALHWIVCMKVGFIGVDRQSLDLTRELALLKIREDEIREQQQLHLQAFLAGQAPFDSIVKPS